MRIAVLGAGYVGLVSGACLADFGHHVTCVDKDSIKISTLKAGKVPIYEPGLDEIVLSNVQQGRSSIYRGTSPRLGGIGCSVHRRRHPVTSWRRTC